MFNGTRCPKCGNEGDTIVNNYTIYYMIDGSGSGDNPDPTPGPTACPHDWQAGTSTAPTCTAPGKTAYTCSKCGETKTETVPALGHDWKVVRTVPTEYDENGTQTQAGYTLYECTRCGEQYKDTDSTGPPGDDVDDGGLLAWLNGLIQHLSDKCEFGAASENFKTYLSCMKNWYDKGWLDKDFSSRTQDMFYQIDDSNVRQGKVGFWCGQVSTLGGRIANVSFPLTEGAVVFGARNPINSRRIIVKPPTT